MTTDELNPGDIIRVKEESLKWSYTKPLKGKDVKVYGNFRSDSFPRTLVRYKVGTKDSIKTMSLQGQDIELVKHDPTSDTRWAWVMSSLIGDGWTIYDSPIRKSDRYKYFWQRYVEYPGEEENWYHCPFCNKPLNPQSVIEWMVDIYNEEEVKALRDKGVVECDCEGWKKREEEYNKMIKLLTRAKKIADKLTAGTLPPEPDMIED